jgi:HTH-type transcriptional regulator / antitoxin HigA
MLDTSLQQTIKVWPFVSDVVFVPHTKEEYERAVALLDELIDEVGGDETHPLASLMETVGTLVEAYETQHFPEPAADPIATLLFLMDEHGLEPADLPELGSETAASEILAGKHDLTTHQIRRLSERFHVSPAVFI